MTIKTAQFLWFMSTEYYGQKRLLSISSVFKIFKWFVTEQKKKKKKKGHRKNDGTKSYEG